MYLNILRNSKVQLSRKFYHTLFYKKGGVKFPGGLDYISDEVHFKHPDSEIKIHLTTDYKRTISENSKSGNSIWMYFPEEYFLDMKNNFNPSLIERCISSMKQWPLLAKLPPNYTQSAVMMGCRWQIYNTKLSFEQLILTQRQFQSTFPTDDALERLASKKLYQDGFKFMEDKLREIWTGNTNVNLIPHDKLHAKIPSDLLQDTMRALMMQYDITQQAKLVLSPILNDMLKRFSIHWLDNMVKERINFENPEKFQLNKFRTITSGCGWVTPPTLTDEKFAVEFQPDDDILLELADACGMINDVLSAPKELLDYLDQASWPRNEFNHNGNNESQLQVSKKLILKANDIHENVLHIINSLPESVAENYRTIFRTKLNLIDLQLVSENKQVLRRYGWIPVRKDN